MGLAESKKARKKERKKAGSDEMQEQHDGHSRRGLGEMLQ